jgi:hypothetical protein
MSSKIEEIIKMNFNKRLYDNVVADLELIFYVYKRNKKVFSIIHGFRKRLPYRNIYIMCDDEYEGHCKICCKKCDLNMDLCSTCDMTDDTRSIY